MRGVSMRSTPRCRLCKNAPARLDDERQQRETDERNEADVKDGIGRRATRGDRADDEGTWRRDDATDVVAKARARAAQARWKQLRQIEREDTGNAIDADADEE